MLAGSTPSASGLRPLFQLIALSPLNLRTRAYYHSSQTLEISLTSTALYLRDVKSITSHTGHSQELSLPETIVNILKNDYKEKSLPFSNDDIKSILESSVPEDFDPTKYYSL